MFKKIDILFIERIDELGDLHEENDEMTSCEKMVKVVVMNTKMNGDECSFENEGGNCLYGQGDEVI